MKKELWLLIAFTLVCLIWLLTPTLVNCLAPLSNDHIASKGQYGDMYGFATSLFSGLTIIGLVYTIIQQQEDLKIARETLQQQREDAKTNIEALQLSRQEMELSKKAIENSTIELKNQLKLQKNQRFDNTFFNLLKLTLEIVAEINQNHLNICVNQFYITGNNVNQIKDEMLNEYQRIIPEHIREQLVPFANSTSYLLKWICDEKKVGGDGRKKYLPLLFAQLRKTEKIFLFYYFNIVSEQPDYIAFEEYLIEYPIKEEMSNANRQFNHWRNPI